MKHITSYLFDYARESKYMLGATTAEDVMRIIVFIFYFQVVSIKAAHYAELQLFTKIRTFTRKLFSQDQD